MKKILFIVFSILVILPTVLPLLNNGFFVVHDNTQVERVFQMTKSLADGNFPVRWVDDLGYGYGYPIFNFYGPFPYYIAGLINLLISNSLIVTKIMFILGTAISFFSMYLFASKITNKTAGLVAGIIYLYFPYHAANIYVRGAVGEFFAYAFLPLVFWAIYYLYENINKNKKNEYKKVLLDVFPLSIPIALVGVSHNLSAFMMGIFLVPYILFFLLISKKKKEFFIAIITLFSSAFLLSSFFTIPAVLESPYTNVSSQVGGGADYPDHFVCLSQLWHSNWGFGGSIKGCVDGLSFSIGKFNVVLVLLAFLFFVYSFAKKKKITPETIFWVLLLISIFLMLAFSKIVWDYFPFMEYLQYPWRFLNFVGLFSSILVAFLVFKIKNKRIFTAFWLVILIGQFYFSAKLFSPLELNNLDNNYYENIEHIRFETSKISDEYMPPDFKKPQNISDLPLSLIESSSSSVLIINYKTGYLEFVTEGQAGKIHINKAAFPSWEAELDGEKINIEEDKKGMNIFVPAGRHDVVLSFKPTIIQTLGNALTLLGVFLVFIAIIVKSRNYK